MNEEKAQNVKAETMLEKVQRQLNEMYEELGGKKAGFTVKMNQNNSSSGIIRLAGFGIIIRMTRWHGGDWGFYHRREDNGTLPKTAIRIGNFPGHKTYRERKDGTYNPRWLEVARERIESEGTENLRKERKTHALKLAAKEIKKCELEDRMFYGVYPEAVPFNITNSDGDVEVAYQPKIRVSVEICAWQLPMILRTLNSVGVKPRKLNPEA